MDHVQHNATVTVANFNEPDDAESYFERRIIQFYEIGVPVILLVCTLTFIVNIIIVVSSRWMRRPLTPTMHFSISLAGADAVASLIVGIGLVLNSLLPAVYDMPVSDWIPCTILTVEAFRLGSVIVTVVHLLALAINHYIGIVRPLHYAAIMTKRTVTICIIAMWILPNVAILTSFSTVENQGFQNPNCTSDFIQSIHFRGQYSSFFFAPLLAMIFIYAHIFVIIRRHQASRRALTQHSTISSMHGGTRNSQNAATIESRYNQPCSENCRQVPPNGHRWSNPRPHHQFINSRSNRISNEPDQSSTVTKNVKAVITTLLIVGTCILGWMPVVVWFIVYCDDCVLKGNDISRESRICIGITVNTLIVLKFFLSPIIYTVRMKDFQFACRRMRYQLIKKCLPRCRRSSNNRHDDDATLAHFNRSLALPSQALGQSSIHRANRFVSDARPVAKIRPVGRPESATEQEGLTQLMTAVETTRLTNRPEDEEIIQLQGDDLVSDRKSSSNHFEQSL